MITVTATISEAQRQKVIADFLDTSGQWLTNEATHRAAMAQAWEEGAQATLRNVSKHRQDQDASAIARGAPNVIKPVYEHNPYLS